MANIVGVNGVTSTEIDLADFKTDYPPGIMVYSAKEAEYKELVMRRDLMQVYPELANTLDPMGLKNFNKYVFFPKFLQDPSLIDVMFPKSVEEMKAEQQNDMLKNNGMPPVLDSDDHQTHIYIHSMSQPKTWATWFHIFEHEEKLAKQQQEAIMLQTAQAQGTPQPQPRGQNTSPQDAAVPLKNNAATPVNSPNINQ